MAQEVRALAQRSADAAKEIKTLISTSSQQVNQGVSMVGQTGEALEAIVTKVGEIHARIGLEPRWYIGGYAVVGDHLARAGIDSMWPKGLLAKGGSDRAGEAVAALMKAIFLDMDFAISIYLETLDNERQRLEAEQKAAQARQEHVVTLLAEALDRLAAGDLLARLDGDVCKEFFSPPVSQEYEEVIIRTTGLKARIGKKLDKIKMSGMSKMGAN